MFRLKGIGQQSTVWVKLLCSGVLSHGHHAVEGSFDKGDVNGEGHHVVPLVMC